MSQSARYAGCILRRRLVNDPLCNVFLNRTRESLNTIKTAFLTGILNGTVTRAEQVGSFEFCILVLFT